MENNRKILFYFHNSLDTRQLLFIRICMKLIIMLFLEWLFLYENNILAYVWKAISFKNFNYIR